MNIKKIVLLNNMAMILAIIGLFILDSNLLNLSILTAFQLIVIMLNLKFYKKEKQNSFLNKHIILLVIFISVISVILALINKNNYERMKTTLIVISSISILLILYITDKNRKENFKNTMNLLVNVVIILVIYAIILRFFGNQYIILKDSKNYIQTLDVAGIQFYQSACGDPNFKFMVGSFTNNPNSLSYLCLFSLIIIFFKEQKSKYALLKKIILIVGLFISGSRLAIILFILLVFINVLYVKKMHKNPIVIVIIFICTFILGLYFIFNSETIIYNIDFNGRLDMWSIAVKEIGFLGKGLGADGDILLSNLGKSYSMHNSYISFAINYGSILLVFFIIFNIFVIFHNIKKILNNNNKMIAYIIYLFLLIIGISESVFFVFGSYQYLFFYCLFYLYTELKDKKREIEEYV